jgi:ribosomal 50S subunit-recycling heat shock protein
LIPHFSEKETNSMRLDKYLKVSRLIKRRAVANEACDGGRVTVNGKVARASYDVKVGDVIALHFGERVLAVEVLDVSETAGKSEASLLYREVNAQ